MSKVLLWIDHSKYCSLEEHAAEVVDGSVFKVVGVFEVKVVFVVVVVVAVVVVAVVVVVVVVVVVEEEYGCGVVVFLISVLPQWITSDKSDGRE